MNTKNMLKRAFWSVTAIVVLTWTACYPPGFESVEQPDETEPNASFEVDISVYSGYDDQVDQIVSTIGVTLPVSFAEMDGSRGVTPYRLTFGIQLPVGWTVADNIAFTGDDEGYFVHSDSLSGLMTLYYPPDENNYWWVSEAAETHNTSTGQIYFSPVITNDGQHGNFFLDYALGYWEYDYWYPDASWSNDHLITCGLQDVIYVTNSAGAGPGSLRAAIDSVAGGGTILFNLATPATIYLNQQLDLYKSVSIIGPESGEIWISGGNTCRIFNIWQDREVHLANLNLVNGSGSGIYAYPGSHGSMQNLVVSGCTDGSGIYFNQAGNWLLQQVTIESNTTTGYGGGIYAYGYSGGQITLSDVIIRGNQAQRGGGICIYSSFGDMTLSGVTIMNNHATDIGGGIYGTSNITFDPVNRCSIYSNTGTIGRDLYGGNSQVIYLDKFTVNQPNDYFAYPLGNFTGFSIQEAVKEQHDQDVYVSPTGSDNNSGTSPANPYRTVSQALAMTLSDPLDPNTIHLAAGTYSPETNGEYFPLYPSGHIILEGQGPGATLLKSSGYLLTASPDDHIQFNSLGLDYYNSISLSGTEAVFSNFRIKNSGNSYEYLFTCSGASLSLLGGSIMNNPMYSSYSIIRGTNSSVITLEDIDIRDNTGGILMLENSSASLQECMIENNTTTSANGLISCTGTSGLEMSGTTIRNNTASAALLLEGTTTAWFDPVNRCNIYDNTPGKEILAGSHTGSMPHLVLDTFSVLHPNDYYVLPCNHFTFDILHGKHQQFSQDLWVSFSGSDENTGLTPEDPLLTVTRACKLYYPEEGANDTIHLDNGYYHLSTSGEELAPLYLADGLTLKGADITHIRSETSNFPAIMIRDHEGVTLKQLNVDGSYGTGIEIANGGLKLDNCLIYSNNRGMYVTGTSTVTGDTTSLITTNSTGIYVTGGNVSLENLDIELNTNSGIYLDNATADLRDLRINDNTRGIDARYSQLTLRNSEITSNGPYGSTSSGLYLLLTEGMLINNTITGNETGSNGGGLYISLSTGQNLTLIDNIIENNKADLGGGIYYEGNGAMNQSLTLVGNHILNNEAGSDGGGLYVSNGTPFIVDCRIEHNKAETGGGIYFSNLGDQVPYLSNTTIKNNLAQNGGGIAFNAATGFDMEWNETSRCNIYLNQAFNFGQDLYCSQQDNVYTIVVDTFSTMTPHDIFSCRKVNYDFDILHGFGELGEFDLYVSPEGDDLNSGLSPEDPLKTLAVCSWRSVYDTLPPHRVFLAEGIYSESQTGEQFPVELRRETEIIGQGTDLTVIDGEYAYQPFVKYDGDTDIMRDLTITGGYSPVNGGGIYAYGGGKLILENIVMDTNRAYFGGAVHAKSTDLELTNVLLTRNRGTSQGGAIHLTNAELSMTASTLSGNIATRGGGMYLDGCTAFWEDVNIQGNRATYGGGLCISHTFGNQAINTRFEDNFSGGSGGAIYINGTATLRDVSLVNNYAQYGGGIALSRSKADLMNLCIAGNTSSKQYGAVYCSNSEVLFDHLTVSGNGTGPGYAFNFIRTGTGTQSIATIRNSNIWGNANSLIQVKRTDLTIEYSNIEHGKDSILVVDGTLHWMHGNKSVDPAFLLSGDHPYQLSSASPCIDAAQPPIPGHKQYPFDLLHNERNVDGNGDGQRVEDIGAYEFQGTMVPLVNIPANEPGKHQTANGNHIICSPNPVIDRATVQFSLEIAGEVTIDLFNAQGNQLERLTSQHYAEGSHEIQWNAAGLAPGMYFLRMTASGESQVVKVVRR